ncbi:Protein of unknown function DUF3511 [Dillenia turbinata]|uniref:Uncharacterized protein n=1 Tax=Dillenia turbinata TaxID=194707 RepID=A0AAN8VBA6_9MAGN
MGDFRPTRRHCGREREGKSGFQAQQPSGRKWIPTTSENEANYYYSCNSKDSEMKRRKRMAEYRAFAVESKVKASLRKSFGWLKAKCGAIVYHY